MTKQGRVYYTMHSCCKGLGKSLEGHYQHATVLWGVLEGSRAFYHHYSSNPGVWEAKTIETLLQKSPNFAIRYFNFGHTRLHLIITNMNIRFHSQHMQEWLCSSRSLTSNTSTKVLSYIKVGYLTLKCVLFKAFQLRSVRWHKVLQGDFVSGTKKI